MVTKVIWKINGRLKFLYRKQSFLNFSLRRMVCNALMQPHFDYAATVWYPNLNRKFSRKVQIAQNKCIRFCLSLENRTHIGIDEFRKINWLPTRERFEQCVCLGAFQFCNNLSPASMSAIFVRSNTLHNTRKSTHMLRVSAKNTNLGQQGLSYIGPKFWNILSSKIKLSTSENYFEDAIKYYFFTQLQKTENYPFLYPQNYRGRYSNLI